MMYFGTFPPDWSAGVRYVGYEYCTPGHNWQGVRDHYLLHYVTDGRGEVRSDRRRFALSRGDAFLYGPGDYLNYTADGEAPWSYVWVGFGGIHIDEIIARLNTHGRNPVISMPYSERVEAIFAQLIATLKERGSASAIAATGLLYELLAALIEIHHRAGAAGDSGRTTAADLVSEAKVFISQNYQREIEVADVIKHIGVDRSHFSRVFRRSEGISLRDYLTRTRMDRAGRLIRETDLPMRAVAASVGYRHYATFERRYRAHAGCSPSETRRLREVSI